MVSNNAANANAVLLMVVPLTSNISRLYVTDVLLPNQRTGLDHDSKAQIEAMRAANVSRLLERLGHVPDDLMAQIDAKLRMHLGI